MRRTFAGLIAAILAVPVALALLAGCGKPDEPAPPQGGTYYTGPMKKKSEAAGQPAGGQQAPP